MDPIASWIVISIAVERLIEVIVRAAPILDNVNIKNLNIKLIMAFMFGLLFAYGAQLDFFKMFGINFIFPYVGEAVSALFVMGGSNYVSDLVGFIRKRQDMPIPVEVYQDILSNYAELKIELDDLKKSALNNRIS